MLLLILFVVVVDAQPGKSACVPGGGYDHFPFCNRSLSTEDRVADLVKRIRDVDKPNLLTARGHLRNRDRQALPYLGVPSYYWGSNCIHSSMFSNCTKDGGCSTSFPSGPSMASTFDRHLVRDIAAVVGRETRAGWNLGNWIDNGKNGAGLDCWGPVINVARDPRWGRNGEGGTEDPYLMGEVASSWTRGLQYGEDKRFIMVAVTLKHFVANSLEGNWGPDGKITRHTVDVNISKYILNDYYWPAFRSGIRAGAKGIMCSYNSVNHIPTCLDPLQRAAREAWGFSGYVTSDSDSISDAWKTHHYCSTGANASCMGVRLGGCDIDSGNTYYDHLMDGVATKMCSMEDVDRAIANSMRVRFELGLFDPVDDQPYWKYNASDIGTPAARTLNEEAALKSLVLLRNDGVLPLHAGIKIAVLGPHGNATRSLIQVDTGVICPSGNFDCVQSPLTAIRQANAGGSTVYEQGCGLFSNDTSGFSGALKAAEAADVVVMGIGISECGSWDSPSTPEEVRKCQHGHPEDAYMEAEAHDRQNIDLPPIQRQLVAEVIKLGKPVVLFVLNGGSVALHPELSYKNVAIIEAFYPGQQGGQALAKALFGENRWGKLPFSMYQANWIDTHSMLDHDVAATNRTYRYGASVDALVPFGYGMSYTDFELSFAQKPADLTLNTDGSKALDISIAVKNTGHVAGDEVVQVYLHPRGVALPIFPIKSLFNFSRVDDVAPGSTKVASFSINTESLLLVDSDGNRVATPGAFEISFETGAPTASPLSVTVQMVGNTVVVEPFPTPN